MHLSSKYPVAALLLGGVLILGCMPPHHAGDEHRAVEHASGTESGHGHRPNVERRVRDPAVVDAASRVRVLARNDLTCRTEVLGLVDVHENVASVEQALGELKLRGAELGAEAVVGVDFEHGDGHEATHLSGMAVRCRDLIRGRQYDVIADVEVPGDMSGEEEAFRRIKLRARELRADLLIDVAFEHGENGRGPTRLRAKAIRFREGEASTAAAP